MNDRLQQAQSLIERPTEGLSVEIKTWIDPAQPEGQAKIVKAVLALRNQNGGHLIIGFDNDTLQPDKNSAPRNVRQVFHIDAIQALVTKYSSEAFEVFVDFPMLDEQEYPVITVPSGAKTPVAVKADLPGSGGKLLAINDVYVRTLNSNYTPSSAKATWKDWSRILEIFFDNREADVGRFLRRHLGSLNPEVMRSFCLELRENGKSPSPLPTIREVAERYRENCSKRLEQVLLDRQLQLPPHGAWEVTLIINGQTIKHSASDFLRIVETSNPQYTGWPIWLISRNFTNEADRPRFVEGVWEQLIFANMLGLSIDFARFDPSGRFYLYRALQEDFNTRPGMPPLTVLDFVLPVIRTAEALAVGIAIAKALGYPGDSTKLAFLFQWSRLMDRRLVSFVERDRYLPPKGPAYQDQLQSYVELPLDTPLSALGDFVERVVTPLFEIFDAFALDKRVFEELTRKILESGRGVF